MANRRADRIGEHRTALDKNKRRVLATQTVCGICGRPVDKTLRWPHPMAPVVDHIVPISRGGDPSDISNLQLAHNICNRQAADKLKRTGKEIFSDDVIYSNRDLPLSIDWKKYRG